MGRVLIIDDEESTREIISIILKKEGHEISTAVDGKQGLMLAQNEKPDIILLDIRMPVMDGIEVLKALKGSDATSPIPVVMITALPQERERAIENGCDEFLTKPIDRLELIARVRSLTRLSKLFRDLDLSIEYLLRLKKGVKNDTSFK
ncbi:hypothetical protein B9J78_03265 [bacterium Unc6]|nr:hypothetical protein [bacterium Unc6]